MAEIVITEFMNVAVVADLARNREVFHDETLMDRTFSWDGATNLMTVI